MTSCSRPIDARTALDWLHGELSEADAQRVEEHLFACAACTTAVDGWLQLGRDVAAVMRAGAVPVAVTAALLEHAREHGMRLREYRMGPGDAIRCTAAPGEDGVVVHIAVDAAPGATVDLVADVAVLGTAERFSQVTEDIVVDRRRGEIAYLFPGDYVRSLPRTRWNLTARTHGGADDALTTCAMVHTPWDELRADEREDA